MIRTSENDSILFKANIGIGRYWENINLDSALSFYDKSFRIAQKNNWLDKQGEVFTNRAFAYYYNNDFPQTFKQLEKATEYYQKSGDSISLMNTYYNLGYFRFEKEDFLKSIANFEEAVVLAKLIKNEEGLASSYNSLGLIFQYNGQYDKANYYQFKALEIDEQIESKSIAPTYVNIALNYLQQQKFDECIEYNKKAYHIFNESGDKTNMALSLKNIGDAMFDKNLSDSAHYYYDKSLYLYKELNNKEAIARYYMLKGNLKQLENKPSEAYKLFKQSFDSLPPNASEKLRIALYSNMASLNLEFLKNKTSEKLILETIAYAKEMLKITSEINLLKYKTDAYLILFKAYHYQKKPDSAFFYINNYLTLKDSLFNFEKQKNITEIQTKYETEKKELKIKNLNYENELINTKLTQSNKIKGQQRTIIYLLFFGFLGLIVAIFFINRYYNFIKRTNLMLKEQNQIILKQNIQNEELLKELHHRIKNNLQIISSLLDLQIKNTSNKDTQFILLDTLSRIKSVGLIHQLLNRKNDISSVNLKELVVKLSDHITSFAAKNPVSTHIEIDKNLNTGIETTLPLSLIITELLTNAFKYAFENTKEGQISISIKETQENKYLLEICDNGPGLSKEQDFNKSLGLKLAKKLGQQLSGELIYKYENGAKFVLEFSRKKRHE